MARTNNQLDIPMIYYAYSGTPGDESDWQTMSDHASAVALGAADFAALAGLEWAAHIAGLFHDLGKYNPVVSPRLEVASVSVDHSTAGAAVLLNLAECPADRLMAELCSCRGADRNRAEEVGMSRGGWISGRQVFAVRAERKS